MKFTLKTNDVHIIVMVFSIVPEISEHYFPIDINMYTRIRLSSDKTLQ
jgi:hypothetical protein